MKPIKGLLKKKFSTAGHRKATTIDDKTVFFIFKKIIQEEFGNLGTENFVPDYFSGQTIFIRCQSSNWASELWLNKNRIIRKINKELGTKTIDEIKIK